MNEFEVGDKLCITKAPVTKPHRVGTIVEVVEDLGALWITDTEVELSYVNVGRNVLGYGFQKVVYVQQPERGAELPIVPTTPVPVVGNPKYNREIKPNVFVDVYDVLYAFKVTDPCLQHLIKKALAVGVRGHKDTRQDLVDIRDSAQRALDSYDLWSHNA